MFGARKLASDDPSQRTDERVVEVVVSAGDAPLLIGGVAAAQTVIVAP